MVDIILVNWNSGDFLRSCLNILSESDWNCRNSRIFVVDNNSNDDSLERLPTDKLRITTIQNKKNRGFGAACNQAAEQGKSELILLLNLDVEVNENTILDSIRFMNDHSEVSVMGCKHIDSEGRIALSCSRYFTLPRAMNEITGLSFLFPKTFKHSTLMKDWDHKESRFVDNVMGAYYLVRRETFYQAGRFDERYFVYLEDVDLSLAILRNGGKVFYNSDISILHYGNATTSSVLGYRLFLGNQSRLRYARKHWPGIKYFVYAFSLFTIGFIVRIFFALVRLDLKQLISVFEAYSYHLF